MDNMGESVIGATVLEQGTTNGTMTDMDGNFELVVSNKEVTLEISYIGYSKSVVKSKVGVPVTVTLKEDTEVLDEVVVVGWNTEKSEFDRCCQSSRGKGFRISSCTKCISGFTGISTGNDLWG